jgi:hypothetical protein
MLRAYWLRMLGSFRKWLRILWETAWLVVLLRVDLQKT